MKKSLIVIFAFLCSILISSISTADLSTGLIAYYPFTGDANDYSGNGNHGVVHGATPTADKSGNPDSAYSFDGIDDFIAIPELLSTTIESFTVAAWVKTSDFNDSLVFYKGAQLGEASLSQPDGTPQFGVKLTDHQWYYATADNPTPLNTYVYLVGIYYKGDRLEIWADGELKMTTPIPDLDLHYQYGYYSSVGAYDQGDYPYIFYNGIIDEIRLYDRALSESEIKELSGISDGFDYPVGIPDGSGYNHTAGWDYLEWNGGVWHPGEDWNGNSGYDSDLGEPVYAVSNGTIIDAGNYGNGWGNIILIEHNLPGGGVVWSQYAHLGSMLKTSGYVNRGEQIGTIGKMPGDPTCTPENPNNCAHLHFEIRKRYREPYNWVTGWSKCDIDNYYYRPSEFIDLNRILPNDSPVPFIKANCMDGPEPVTISKGDALSVKAELVSRSSYGKDADWWVLLSTSSGLFYYDLAGKKWKPGIAVTYQGALYNLNDLEVLNTSALPVGTYIFYFGVDMNMNGSMDAGQLHLDSVDVRIDP